MSHLTCHLSHITCHLSYITCHVSKGVSRVAVYAKKSLIVKRRKNLESGSVCTCWLQVGLINRPATLYNVCRVYMFSYWQWQLPGPDNNLVWNWGRPAGEMDSHIGSEGAGHRRAKRDNMYDRRQPGQRRIFPVITAVFDLYLSSRFCSQEYFHWDWHSLSLVLPGQRGQSL